MSFHRKNTTALDEAEEKLIELMQAFDYENQLA